MMTHVEGPIVDSLYDVCLLSWSLALQPPLPLLNESAANNGYPSFEQQSFRDLFDEHGKIKVKSSTTSTEDHPDRMPSHDPGDPHYDDSFAHEFVRMQSCLEPTNTDDHIALVAKHLNLNGKYDKQATASSPTNAEEYFNPFLPLAPHDPVPIALVNRKPKGAPVNTSLDVPQNAAFMAALRYAKEKVFIQTPDLNAKPLLPEIVKAIRRGIEVEYWVCLGYNDAGELLPMQGGTNDMIAKHFRDELKNDDQETQKRLKIGWYTAKDQIRPIHKKEQGRCCHSE